MTPPVADYNLLDDLTDVFHTVFDDTDLEITPETINTDLEAWDSLGHIRLIAAVEEHFNIEFEMDEIGAIMGVSNILKLIGEKSNQA